MAMETLFDATTKRQRIKQDQKVWKFIRDTNSIDLNDLNKIAVVDGMRKYTFGQMFHEWDRYAAVFSALGMTGQKDARVGILGSPSAEVVFAFYGLNMVGAEVSIVPSYFALILNRVMVTIREEKLTDFIITDDFAQANLVGTLLAKREELGLRNVIVLHVPVAGETVAPMLMSAQEAKYALLKNMFGPICMDELLKAYETYPVAYAANESAEIAIILHTSGTTSGMGNPVALSDKAFNAAVYSFYKMKDLALPFDNLVTAVSVELSNVYSMVVQVHLPFAVGASVVMVPSGVLNPNFYKAIPAHGISFLFTIGAMFERWMKLPEEETKQFNFSSLRFVALGGSAVSARDKRRYHEFLVAHGGSEEIVILNGYGLSELGGACCLSTPDLDDEAIGYALPGFSIRLFDEEKGVFYSEKDFPCEGVLYMTSSALATSTLDGKEILKTEMVGRKPYFCTNDYVRVEEDGKIVFLGRANRFFLYDEGKKYASGRVETEFSRQLGIEGCGIVPVYIKTSHDNIPMLCVKTLPGVTDEMAVVTEALMGVFTGEDALGAENVPYRVMFLDELPRNRNGKVDLFKINRGEVQGKVYTVETVKEGDEITGFSLVPFEEGKSDMMKEVFDGISADIKASSPLNMNKDGAMENPGKVLKDKTREGVQAMNYMGQQMVNNQLWQMFPGRGPAVFPCYEGFKKQQAKMQDISKQEKQKTMEVPNMYFMGKAMENFNEMNRKGFEMMGNMMGQMQRGAAPSPMPFFGMPFGQPAPEKQAAAAPEQAAPQQANATDIPQDMQKAFANMMDPMKMFANMPNMQDVFAGMQKMMADMPKPPQMCENMQNACANMPNLQQMFANMPNMMQMFANMPKPQPNAQQPNAQMPNMQQMFANMPNMMQMFANMPNAQQANAQQPNPQQMFANMPNPQQLFANMQQMFANMPNAQQMNVQKQNMQQMFANMQNAQQANMQQMLANMQNVQNAQQANMQQIFANMQQLLTNMQQLFANMPNPMQLFANMPNAQQANAPQQLFANMPNPQQLFANMPNPQQLFANMPNPQAAPEMPNPMQNMMDTMQARMNQKFENMSQMNQSMLAMMKNIFEQNSKMMEKFFAATKPAAPAEDAPVEVVPAEDVTVEEAPQEESAEA